MNDELVCTVEGAAGGEKQSCYTMDRNQAELWLATVDDTNTILPKVDS
jgi:hypothetical protein